MQELRRLRPLSINTDVDELLLGEDEAAYLRNYRIGFNRNANSQTGSGNGGEQGGNFGTATPLLSSTPAASAIPLPIGRNHTVGSYECKETNEIYYFNWNSNGLHGIYRVSGNSLDADIVYVGRELNFSLDPKHGLKNRVYLKVAYDSDGEGVRKIKSKYLVFTDGKNWQRWIDVETSVATQGFNPTLFPYYKPTPPHFRSEDLINLAVVPPFYCPQVEVVAFSTADVGKSNALLNKSVQFAYQYLYTDGRSSTLSPYSNNVVIGAAGCSDLNTNNPRCVDLTLEAGNPHVEKVRVLFRICGGDWYLYDTVDKYQKCLDGEPFYERKIVLDQYNAEENTFIFRYCGDKECAIFSVEDAKRVQTDLPIQSFALSPLGDSLMLCDNLYFYDNFDCETLENISVSVVTPDETDTNNCTAKNVTINCYATIRGGPLIRTEEDGPARFGDLQGGNFNPDPGIGSVYANGVGPIGYLANTPYATVGECYRVDRAGAMEKVGVLNWYDGNVRNAVYKTFRDNGYYIIKFTFVVPAGYYLFRIAGHAAKMTDANYQQTSTFVAGVANVDRMDGGGLFPYFIVRNLDYTRKEIEVNACSGDYDSYADNKKVLDYLPPYLGDINREKWIDGYITDTSDADKKGIELLQYVVDEGFPETIRSGNFTDHNGYFFTSVQRGGANEAEVVFWGEFECQMKGRDNYFLRTSIGKRPRGTKDFHQNIAIKDAKGTYKPCNEVRVQGKVVDENGVGISGVSVVITRGGSALTNSAGEFVLKVHKGNVRGDVEDRIFFNSIGGCLILNAADCSCIPYETYTQPASNCVCGLPRIYDVTVTRTIRYVNNSNKGLKGGGRYGISIVGRDGAGRATFSNNIGYVDIPTFLQTGNYTPSVLKWEVTESFILPKHIKYFSFYRTKNLNYGSYLQWVGDKIQFINARGQEIASPDEAVRAKITIQSLLDFNEENNFATTVGYQFVKGDILRIYDNGDGKLFPVNEETPFLDYPILGTDFNSTVEGATVDTEEPDVADGKSFLIAYDKRLDVLKDKCSFWIEIMRPHNCKEREIYYEICGTIAVVDGKVINDQRSGMLETWDTYYQTRFIRPEGCTAKSINHPFESSSITDFWGDNCDSVGRISIADPQAAQQWYGEDVIRSDDFVNEGRVNGLGTFRESNRKTFRGSDTGAIIAAHAEGNIVAFICQNDWFLADYNMNYLRATAEGLVVANLDNALSEPHQKKGAIYGCEFEDNNTIVFEDGICIWADRKNANVVLMDYSGASDMAAVDNKSYFVTKFRYVAQFNSGLGESYLDNLIEINAGFDPKYKEYLITFRPRRGLSQDMTSYVNDEREPIIEMQETLVFNLEQRKWVRFTGYAPEHFGLLRYSISGLELVAFAAGAPHFLNSNSVSTYNTFFGIKTDQVITIAQNYDPSKVKVFQAITVESNGVKYYVDQLYTNEINSYSYIPLSYWKRKEGVYYSEIQRDMNTYPDARRPYTSTLIDGKRIFGLFAMIRLVRDINMRTAYNELNNVWVRFIGSEQSEK